MGIDVAAILTATHEAWLKGLNVGIVICIFIPILAGLLLFLGYKFFKK